MNLILLFHAENAISAFGNGSDVKTSESQQGMPSPAADSHSPHFSTAAPGVSMETEHNVLRAQIPTQVRWDETVTMFNKTFFLLQTAFQMWVTEIGGFVLIKTDGFLKHQQAKEEK